ncbi:hypothetical protein A2U01_0108659, partial [Trifolium medium]|nr:hypothetical protein [Trifolium medium]
VLERSLSELGRRVARCSPAFAQHHQIEIFLCLIFASRRQSSLGEQYWD